MASVSRRSRAPLDRRGRGPADAEVDIAEEEVAGLLVLTHTCEIVRSCKTRPYLEICPLVEADAERLHEAARGRLPRWLTTGPLKRHGLVADLDRVMTVEKAVAAGWAREPGTASHDEARWVRHALARKRARAAFPDDFVELAQPLARRLASKHDKQSDEGAALRALREIRVRAAPDWAAEQIELTFWFVRHAEDHTFAGQTWDQHLEAWEKRLESTERFSCQCVVLTLDDLTAREYVERMSRGALSEACGSDPGHAA